MDPCKIDWNYQIKNRPNSMMQVDDFPISRGPFSGPTIFVDNDGGLAIDSAVLISTLLASIIQQGVIGTRGGQQIAGMLTIAPAGTATPAPVFTLPNFVFCIQDDSIAFYNSAEGSRTSPGGQITYDLSGSTPFLHLLCDGWVELIGGQATTCRLSIQNNYQGSFIELDELGDMNTFTPQVLTMQAGNGTVTLGAQGLAAPASVDLSDGMFGNPYFSLNLNTLIGQYATVFGGLTFSGGLLTDDSGTYTLSAGSIALSGFAPGELLYVDSGSNLAGTPNITTDGTVVNMNDPGTGHTLEIAPDIGSQGAFLFANVALNLDADGTRINLSSNTDITFGPSNSTINFWMTNARFLTGLPIWFNSDPDLFVGGPDTGLERNAPGDVGFTDAAGTTGAIIGIDGAQLCLAPASMFAVFGGIPASQYNTPGQLAGFTPNASANNVFNESTWDGGLGGSAYTIDDMVAALISYGWLAP